MLLRRGRFVLAGSVLCNLFAVQRHTLSTRFAPPPHELVTRTPALDDAHQSVDTLGMFLRRGRNILLTILTLDLFAAQRHTLCTRFAPPPHELVTRTPALDDAHQSVDTLGMLLRQGTFVLMGSVLSTRVWVESESDGFPLHTANIGSIPLEAQCVPRWVDMVGKLPPPLSDCHVHPVRGPTWWGNFPLHSVNVVSIPLEA
ncbi:hypothetical protein B0H13DRAFT_1857486 [Mycena leptocephala]|nr:hypothetical protein B0H13DRAFT_1857486 [Mycena leptocephala]